MFERYIEAEKENILERLFETLRIPSISTDPAYRDDCLRQAHYFVDLLKDWEYQSELAYPEKYNDDEDTQNKKGLPSVFAQNQQIAGRPTLLFYGHYDVQPVDPLSLWDHDPFDPIIKNTPEGDVIQARGANDNKGQLFTFLEALRAFDIDRNGLNLNIKILLEGEEESGSPSLSSILKQYKEKLSCDAVLISDTNMWRETQPALTIMLRGSCAFEVTLEGSERDLHSGLYGGPVANPANILSRIIGKMFDDENHVLIPGFYDDIENIDPALKKQWKPLEGYMLDLIKDVQMTSLAGEKEYSAIEQNWCRPTVEINGLSSGYQGDGHKSIIPMSASVKISCRLVKGQKADRILQLFTDFFNQHAPSDISVKITKHGYGQALNIDYKNPYIQSTMTALNDVFSEECLLVGCGASIPAAIDLYDITKAPIILGGWGLPSDAIHAPNEIYGIQRFFKGIEGWAAVLSAIESKKGL